MKKLFLLATIACCTSIAAFAQHDHSSHQQQNKSSSTDTSTKVTVDAAQTQQHFALLLTSYLNIKNALVSDDVTSAAANALLFLKVVNTIDFKVISEGNLHILLNDAGKISSTKDLEKQRNYFANLSFNMASIAKVLKLSDKPIYMQYCPMKKAAWLSNEKQIRNPYYGSSMLTCGEVTDTL